MATADLRTRAIKLLATKTGVDLTTTVTETVLYTVPTGKTLIIDHIIMRSFSADPTTSTVTFGQAGTATNFMPGPMVLTGITSSYATQCVKIEPVPHITTPLVRVEYAAATEIVIKTVVAGAGTCTVEVWGRLY